MTKITVAGACLCAMLVPAIVAAAGEVKRFTQLTAGDLDAAQHEVADEVLKVSSLGLQGPYNVMLRSPVMAKRMVSLLDYLRFKTSVPRRLNEFAILIQARLWTSQVEWKAHYPLAIKAGLSEAVAADLLAGRRPAAMQPDEAAVYDLCVELSTGASKARSAWLVAATGRPMRRAARVTLPSWRRASSVGRRLRSMGSIRRMLPRRIEVEPSQRHLR